MQKYTDTIFNRSNKPMAGALITVKTYPAGAAATIYASDGGAAVPSVATDGNGRFAFYAADGHYSLTVSGNGIAPYTLNDIVLNDPANDAAQLSDYPSAAAAIAAASGGRLHIGNGQALTLNVPATFATPQAALTAMAGWSIAASGTVTIQVADGTYALTGTTLLDHQCNDRIRLIGNSANKAACVLLCSTAPTFDAFICARGSFGLLDGFTIRCATKATSTNNATAILALNGGIINCGPNIAIDNWYYGVAARAGGRVYANYVTVDHAGDVGIWAETGGFVECRNAVSNNTSDSTNNLGFGFQAEHGSSMDCSNASASGCRVAGIAALSGSSVRAWNASASNNTGSGLYAFGGSVIEAHNAVANTNTRYGVEELDGSRIFGNAMTLTGNTLAATKAKAYFDNTSLGPRVVADGDFRLDLSGVYSWYFNSPGGIQFSAGHTANAVNRCHLTGSATGQAVRVAALGNDTNIDLALATKGSGVVQFGTNSASADAPVTGYITIRDAGGTLRKLAVIA